MSKLNNKTRRKQKGGATVANQFNNRVQFTPMKIKPSQPFAPQKSKQQSSRITNGQSVRRLIDIFEGQKQEKPQEEQHIQPLQVEYGNTQNTGPNVPQYNTRSINNKPYQKIVQKSNQVKMLPGAQKQYANTRKLNKSAYKSMNHFKTLQPHITNTQKAKNIIFRPKLKNMRNQNQLGRATRRLISLEE